MKRSPIRRGRKGPRLPSIKGLEKRADEVFSVYIRTKWTDSLGFVACYTCGREFHWKNLHCGHWIGRAKRLYRWDERNARPQCNYCNTYLYGNLRIYTMKLEKEIGRETCLEMESRQHEVCKRTREDLLDIIARYREAITHNSLPGSDS